MGTIKHGLRNHPLYKVWSNIKDRCYNVRQQNFHNYGGRDIRMCDEWKNDFKKFYKWCIINGWKPYLQIDRRENDGNYEPNNCRFVTCKINANNRRTSRYLTFEGQTHTISEWSDILNIPRGVLMTRLNLGWNVEKTLSTAYFKRHSNKNYFSNQD